MEALEADFERGHRRVVGMELINFSDEERAILDQIDPHSVRGRKLERDRVNLKGAAKVWTLVFMILCIFFLILRSNGDKKCRQTQTCECLQVFEGFYTGFIMTALMHCVFRVDLSCRS